MNFKNNLLLPPVYKHVILELSSYPPFRSQLKLDFFRDAFSDPPPVPDLVCPLRFSSHASRLEFLVPYLSYVKVCRYSLKCKVILRKQHAYNELESREF